MKILLTSLSGQLGGLELRLADEARALNKLEYNASLAISDFPDAKKWFSRLENEGLTLNQFNVPPFFDEWSMRHINYLKARFITTRQLRKLKPDLIHVAYAWTETGGGRLWLASQCKIPSVISVHNAFPEWKMTDWHIRLTKQAFKSVKGIYAVSESALEHFQAVYSDYYPRDLPQEIIYNFVDTTQFSPSQKWRKKTRNTLNIPDNDILIGTIGRLDRQKNPLYTLDCFKEIRKTLSNAHLIFIGQGNLMNDAKEHAKKLGLTPWVKFSGFITNLEQIIPALDLHMLLSTREGFGIATVEAMACGIPVIGSHVPGTTDILNNSFGGELAPLNAPKAVSKIAVKILESKTIQKNMSKHARQEAIHRFSKDIWTNKIQNFYKMIGNEL